MFIECPLYKPDNSGCWQVCSALLSNIQLNTRYLAWLTTDDADKVSVEG